MARSKMKFEEGLALLEKIVEELESGDLTLDESLARYEQGVKAFKMCHEMLRDAEKRVEALLIFLGVAQQVDEAAAVERGVDRAGLDVGPKQLVALQIRDAGIF